MSSKAQESSRSWAGDEWGEQRSLSEGKVARILPRYEVDGTTVSYAHHQDTYFSLR